jgi:hypothetical protein
MANVSPPFPFSPFPLSLPLSLAPSESSRWRWCWQRDRVSPSRARVNSLTQPWRAVTPVTGQGIVSYGGEGGGLLRYDIIFRIIARARIHDAAKHA